MNVKTDGKYCACHILSFFKDQLINNIVSVTKENKSLNSIYST